MSENPQNYSQRIELLAVGRSSSDERTVVLTVRVEKEAFTPFDLCLSRKAAIRLLRCLRTVLRQSAGVVLYGIALVSTVGCSGKVELTTERTTQGSADHEAATAMEQQRAAIAVRLLDRQQSAPVEEGPSEPARNVGVTGNKNCVIVVEGDVHLGEPDTDDRSGAGGKNWNTAIPWREPSQQGRNRRFRSWTEVHNLTDCPDADEWIRIV